jgi:hypothetical protein
MRDQSLWKQSNIKIADCVCLQMMNKETRIQPEIERAGEWLQL